LEDACPLKNLWGARLFHKWNSLGKPRVQTLGIAGLPKLKKKTEKAGIQKVLLIKPLNLGKIKDG
jgi:hypothetical protein